jgi:hypothetical protein
LNYSLCMNCAFLLGVAGLLIVAQNDCFSQCKEKISPANHQTVHYHTIPLSGKKEYLTLSRTGEERVLSYHNEQISLVYHVLMFTEMKFSSSKGNFSLYSTTSDRSNWQPVFILSSPLTPKDLEKMKGTLKIEILLPEDTKVFTFTPAKNELLNEAIACMR